MDTALTVTRGTVDLSGWNHNLRLRGALSIEANGRWSDHDNSTYYVQFYGEDCTYNDATGSQNLGHVKVDE